MVTPGQEQDEVTGAQAVAEDPNKGPFKTAEEAQAVAEQRKALVKRILDDVKAWKEHHKDAFKRMKKNVKFVKNAGNEQWRSSAGLNPGDDRYVANVTHRFIQQKVSSLYARDPKVKAKRRQTIEYQVWDGRQETLQTAILTVKMVGQQLAMAGINTVTPGVPPAPMGAPAPAAPPSSAPPPAGHNGGPPMGAPPMGALPGPPPMMMDPATALMIVKEAIDIRAHRDMIDKIGKTAEILFQHTIDTAVPSFKTRMKQAVRRAATCSVAWIKLDFERTFDGYTPRTQDQISGFESRIKSLEATLGNVQTNQVSPGDASLEELKQGLSTLMDKPDMLLREGLVFDFSKSWDIIVDDECRQLVGLVGCKRMAHQFESTVNGIKANFGVDVGQNFTAYKPDGTQKKRPDSKPTKVMWYEVYDSTTGLVYSVLEGYPDFLCEPCEPRIEVPQFFPFYPIVLNEVENDEDLYPPSDVDLIEHQQKELNRSREALRQHRIAASPYTVGAKGKLSEDDKNRLMNRAPHEHIELQAMVGQQKVQDLFQAGPTSPIDPNLYEDNQIMQDILRAGGAQEANLGPTAGGTATEAGIAEGSRSQTVSSNVDDIDTALSQITRDATLVMFKEVSLGMAQRIAGKGAVWPEMTSNDISGELYLDIVAGSSGKPNREREAAAFERIVPMALNIPGINPAFLARKAVEAIDDAVDMDDAVLDGIPSVMSMNAMLKAQPTETPAGTENTPSGDPRSDPGSQGDQGANNQEQPMGTPGGPQAGNPAPDAAATATLQGRPLGT